MNKKLSFSFWSAVGYTILFLLADSIASSIFYAVIGNLSISSDLKLSLGICVRAIVYGLVIMYICKISKTKLKINVLKGLNKGYILPTLLTVVALRLIANTLVQLLVIFVPMSESLNNIFNSLMFTIPCLRFIFFAVLIPILEELFFRVVLAEGLAANYSRTKTIIYSTLIFAIVHGNIYQFVSALLLGSLACYVYLKTKNILLPVLVHTVWNGFYVVLEILPIKFEINTLTDIFSAKFLIVHAFSVCLLIAGIILLKKQNQSPIKTIEM